MELIKKNLLGRLLGRKSTYVAPGFVPGFELEGVHFPESQDIISDFVLSAIRNRSYEALEAKYLQQIIHGNERVLEIGAGIGLISTLAAQNRLVAKVVAYEANPVLCKFQEQVHKINMVKVDLRNGVLLPSPKFSTAEFFIHKDFWSSSLTPSSGTVGVANVRVDDFQIVIEKEDPTLLIVDIEGGELDLFDGIDFKNIRRVLIEIHQNTIGRDGVQKVFNIFSTNGFHYDQWHSSGAVIVFSHIGRVNLPIN